MAQMDKVKFLSPIEAPNIDVTGDIRVQGESIISSLETVVTKENTIKLRDGATGALMSNEYTGIIAEKYDGTNNGMLVFDSNGTAYVGDEGDLQPLATRVMDADDNGKYAYWDSENQTLKPGLLNEKNNAVYVGDNKIITSVDSVTSAEKLTTARKISLGTGVSSTATSFNGTSNITIPVTEIKEAYLKWGGKDISGGLSAFDVSIINELSQNAFSFLSDDAITIEYSNDGGITWLDYEASSKANLVTEGLDGHFYLGKHYSAGTATTDDQLRVTFNKGAYFVLRKLAIYMSTKGCGNCTCTVETCLVNSTPDTWTVLKENVPISGYSGWNILNLNVTYGGHQSWANSIRLTFKQATAPTSASSSADIHKIYAYSGTTYSYANNYAKTGHIYTFDANQNTTFPAGVAASKIETGTSDDSYFQSRRFRGQGDASAYNHAIDFGYEKNDKMEFYEWGGVFNFYKCKAASGGTSTKEDAILIGAITENGFEGNATSATTAVSATQDGDGNVIATTYATKTELENAINTAITSVLEEEY